MTGQFQDIQYRQAADDPTSFCYIAGALSAELTPDGAPSASLIKAGDGGFLQMGVHWDLSPAQAAQLTDYLRKQFPDLTTAPVLRPEAATVDCVDLVLTMPDRSNVVLASGASSGFPPYSAVFSMMLNGAQFAQASAAFSGREDVLKVQYRISAPSKLACTATVAGDVRPDVQELDPDADADACRSRIDAALSAGRLQLTVGGDKVSDELRDRTVEAAKQRAGQTLQRMLSGADADLDAAHLLASVTLGQNQVLKLTREADVGHWFTGSKAMNLIVAAS